MSFLSYSQNGEDVLLWRALGHVNGGFYIDVGANDPVANSVTKAFYDAGWHGINIEPLPGCQRALQAQRPRDINLAVAAGASEGRITLFDVPAVQGWASPDRAVAEAHRADGFALAELTVPMRPLSDVCAEYAPAAIHFLKIDVEGFEGEVLRGMDLARWRPWVLVIEATQPNSRVPSHAAWEALVTGRGYRMAWFDGLNRYYVADEHAALIPQLALQPNVFDDAISYHLHSARQASQQHEARQAAAEIAAAHADQLAQQAQTQLVQAQDRHAKLQANLQAKLRANLQAKLRAKLQAKLRAKLQANLQAKLQAGLQAKLARLRCDLDAQDQRTQAMQAWAGELERHLLAIRRSTSWRVTAPLRLAGSLPRRLRAALRRAMLRASASERVRRLLIPVLLRFPGQIARITKVLADIKRPAAPPADVPELPPQLRALPPKARRVLGDLLRAREQVREFAPADGTPWRDRAMALIRARPGAPPARPQRPRLAYVSPLPPVRSGIADYSAELVPQLARFYDIELIVDQDSCADARLAQFPLHPHDWFDQHAQQYDRVLYHVGNSQAHQYMFALIRRHPGVVVLHDFFLSGVLDHMPDAFYAALYESHGYSGLLDHAAIGRNAAIWKYPLNKGVLDNAAGVIVHSEFARQLAQWWYGGADDWRRIPLLRGTQPVARDAARERLGLARDDYLVCSFGMLGRTKLNDELADAFLASPLGADRRCQLVFVGQNEAGLYGVALAKKIAGQRRMRITGFVNAPQYADYLAACDCAVQLRGATRGETSASVLDCLLHGVPTIVNAHGSSAEIDDALLFKLPDIFTISQLAGALASLRAMPERRALLGQRASNYVLTEHTPIRVGQLYADAIEHFAAHAASSHYQRLVTAIAGIPGPATDADLADAARAIAHRQGPCAPRQLLVDVSALVAADLKTGIQRVVRSVLMALIADPPAGWRIEPVFSTGSNRPYQYARRFTLDFLGVAGPALDDAPADLHPGDTFLGLDLFTNGTTQNEDLLRSMRELDVRILFVVYDLLPVLHPDFFPFGTEQYFSDFLRTVSTVSDALLCISKSVADQLAAWIAAQGIAAPRLAYFHLGADIAASAPSAGLPAEAMQIFDAVASRPSFLMVGTVEPRKGHAQALAAFELLWREGLQVNLVIVGKQGWMVDQLAARLERHPSARLFWLPGVSDEMLLGLYQRCAALLAASEGEGFGLPLIEAAQHGLPVIARDLPVFREVAGQHAFYFSGLEAEQLAAAVRQWLALDAAPQSRGMPWLTWKESARQVIDAVEGRRWI